MINYQCSCGHAYALEDSFAGKTVECYVCHALGRVVNALPGIAALLKTSWQIYRKHWLSFFEISAIGLATAFFFLLTVSAAYFLSLQAPEYEVLILTLGIALAWLFAAWMVCWTITACYAFIAKSDSVRQAFIFSKPKIRSMFWIGSLIGFLVAGAFMLLFLPGFIYMFWFFFAPYLLLEENAHGMFALLKSRAYLKNRNWAVAGRLMPMFLAMGALLLIPIIGQILFAFFFAVCFCLWLCAL